MKTSIKFLFLPLFFFCLQNILSLEIEITDKGVEAYLGGNYTRGSNLMAELSAAGGIELNKIIGFRCGLSVGRTLIDTEINTFLTVNYSPFSKVPVIFSVSHIWNGLPEYEAHANTLLPYVSFKAKRAGISLGANFRFTSYFREKAQFESVISFYGYFNFINNDKICFGLGAGNFNEFHANNLGAIFVNLYISIPLNNMITLYNDIEYMQSGMDGLTATLYRTAFKTGVKITW